MPMDVIQHLISKKSAKEAWDTLKILNLGHGRLHEATLQTFQKKFENLEVGEDETLDAFASRVATIVNGIRGLDEKLEEISVVRRFLRPHRHGTSLLCQRSSSALISRLSRWMIWSDGSRRMISE
jgi:hypothetical protein